MALTPTVKITQRAITDLRDGKETAYSQERLQNVTGLEYVSAIALDTMLEFDSEAWLIIFASTQGDFVFQLQFDTWFISERELQSAINRMMDNIERSAVDEDIDTRYKMMRFIQEYKDQVDEFFSD